MKQRNLLRRVTSIICAIAMVVTSLTAWDVTKVSADTESVIILKDDEERSQLITEAGNADYNFALNKNAEASMVTGGNNGGTDLTVVTNGVFATNRSASTTVTIGQKIAEDKWVQVDLGKAYDTSKIDRVAVQYYSLNTSARGGYTILYSLNGMSFVEVGSVEAYSSAAGNPIICLDKITLTQEQSEAIPYARYVRVVAKNETNNTNNGLQVMGMAVLTDGVTKVSEVEFQEVETLDDPVSLTVTSSNYEQLEYVFTKAEGDEGDYVYYAYIDGSRKEEAVVPGENYVVTGLTGGEHTVKIVATKEGINSEGITRSVMVTDTKSLLTDERNFAIGKKATASSIRENDSEANITDGNLTNLFRTATTDTESTIIIDLGDNYRLDAIERTVALYAAGRYPKNYTIDFSSNGVDYETVATAEGTGEVQSVAIDAEECSLPAVRYVRFSLSNPVTGGYGFQMNELGVIIKEDADMTPVEVETLDDVTSLTVTSGDYGQLEYVFEKAEGDNGDYTYIAYIDGNRQEETVEPGETYVVTGLTGGSHTVRIVAFKDGIASEGVTESVEVTDPKDLIATDRNIALGRKAESSSTRVDIVNDEEVPDDITKLTDGDLKTQFRTLQTEPTASIVIDLGAEYKLNIIELVAMSYINDRYAKAYTIDYSQNGTDFETVCTGTGEGTFQYSKINPTDCTLSTVRYVRVNVSEPFAEGFGFQFYEIAVITKDKSLDDTEIKLNQEEYTYTGMPVLPDVTITFGDKTLEQDKDYVIRGTDNNINVGPVKAVLEGAGSYAGSKEVNYTIIPAELKNAVVSTSFDENGALQVGLSYNNIPLEQGKDYTYTTKKNEDGDMLISLQAAGNNFTGTSEKVVPITDFPVSEVANVSVTSTALNKIDVTFENPDTFAGDSQLYDVYLDGKIVSENVTAGTYSYENQNAGVHKVKVTAKLNGQTSSGVEQEVTVQGMDISQYKLVLEDGENAPSYIYSGDPIIPNCSVVNEDGTETLQADTDYTIEFSNNTNAGTAQIVVTGKGLYEGSLEGTFEISAKEITEADIDFSKVAESYIYTGTEVKPQIGMEGLTEGTDYTVAITDNLYPGTAKIVVSGVGNYTGQVTKQFTIKKKNIQNVQITAGYNGKTLVVTVKDGNLQMIKDKDYKYTVAQDAAGNVTVTVEGVGNCYEGRVVRTISAKNNPNAPTTAAPKTTKKKVLKKTTVSKASKKKASKKVSITFKKVQGAKKYQVQIAVNKKFKKVLVRKTVKKVKITITSKKLKNKKKLYVRVKAVGAKKWSKVKRIKIRK